MYVSGVRTGADGCGRVWTGAYGAYGCKWVRWGATTLKHKKNKRKQDKNECAGYVFDACMAGKFPEKHIHVRPDIKGL